LRHQADISKDYFYQNFDEEYIMKPVVKKLDDILYFNIFQMGLEELLRFADRNSMAHGREIRLPFLSHELVEFVFALPSSYKIRQGFTKWILRKSIENLLPTEIVWRREKIGFEPPQKLWMQNKKLQDLINESKKKLISKGILNEHTLQKNINPSNAYDAENSDWRYLAAAQIL
jgi:asparagine synthase (glutamine-hydrolysing)